ncbi:Myb/SANT-like DNA-binding domain [Popillia japonica]|uniref:Myb/SANT-like DNA-binding domain n=1 Tax=Popillia japonica TaxID=7064 RepID=A0AAW1MY40_POPJA
MENSNENLNNPNYWTTKETLALISAYEQLSDRLSHARKRKHVWELIAHELLSLGITKSVEKCEMKWRNLINTYKPIKDNKKSTGRGAIRFQFYNKLDEILGDKLAMTCKHATDTTNFSTEADIADSAMLNNNSGSFSIKAEELTVSEDSDNSCEELPKKKVKQTSPDTIKIQYFKNKEKRYFETHPEKSYFRT